MAAKGPGSRTRLWAAALLLLGLPGLSVRAEGECPGSAREAAGRGGAWVLGGESEARRGCPVRRARNTTSLGGNKERSCPATPPPSCSSPSPRAPKRPHRAPEPLLNAQEKACALVLQARL